MSIEGYDFISFVFLAFIELSILGHSKRTDFKIFFNQGEWISAELGSIILNTKVYKSNVWVWYLEFVPPPSPWYKIGQFFCCFLRQKIICFEFLDQLRFKLGW